MNKVTHRFDAVVTNTDRQCLIVMSQLAESPTKALILNLQALDTYFASVVEDALRQPEAETVDELYELFDMLKNGKTNLLNHLHSNGLLAAANIDAIMVKPDKQHAVPLKSILLEKNLAKGIITQSQYERGIIHPTLDAEPHLNEVVEVVTQVGDINDPIVADDKMPLDYLVKGSTVTGELIAKPDDNAESLAAHAKRLKEISLIILDESKEYLKKSKESTATDTE